MEAKEETKRTVQKRYHSRRLTKFINQRPAKPAVEKCISIAFYARKTEAANQTKQTKPIKKCKKSVMMVIAKPQKPENRYSV